MKKSDKVFYWAIGVGFGIFLVPIVIYGIYKVFVTLADFGIFGLLSLGLIITVIVVAIKRPDGPELGPPD